MTGILGNTLYIRVHGAQTRVSPVSICTYPYIQLRVYTCVCICVYALVYGTERERGTVVTGRVLHA